MKWYATVLVSDFEMAIARSNMMTIVIARAPHTPTDSNIID